MKNLYKIQDELYIIDNNEKVTQNGIWAKCSFTGDILKNRNGQYAHKVILTTNKLLIKDGVQSIDDEFLEWFVKNSSCEEVEVEKIKQYKGNYLDCFHTQGQCDCGLKPCKQIFFTYKIIIPKEEPKQEQTLEEVAEEYAISKNSSSVFQKAHIRDFIAGAKWQQERMYSDMQEYAEFCVKCDRNKMPLLTVEDWYKQYKK